MIVATQAQQAMKNIEAIRNGCARRVLSMLEGLADSTEALFDEMANINLKGAYFTVQRALPLLSEGASIILTSSAGRWSRRSTSAWSIQREARPPSTTARS